MLDNFEKKKKFVPYPKGRDFDNQYIEEKKEMMRILVI